MQDPLYAKIESVPRPTLFAASGLVLLASIGLWASELLFFLLPGLAEGGWLVQNACYYLPFVAAPIAVYMIRRPGLSDAMRLKPLPALPTLSVALLALLSVYAASALSTAWGYGLNALGLHSFDTSPQIDSREALILAVFALGAMPAVFEELLFRGFVLAAWEGRGTWFAVGVSALLFALLHGNLFGLPTYLLVGAVSGFVTFALDSVYASMVYHTLYNAACLILIWLAAGTGESEAAAASEGAQVFSIVLNTVTVFAMMAMLMATLRLWARNRGIAPVPRIRRPLAGCDRVMLLAAVGAMTVTTVILLALAGSAA